MERYDIDEKHRASSRKPWNVVVEQCRKSLAGAKRLTTCRTQLFACCVQFKQSTYSVWMPEILLGQASQQLIGISILEPTKYLEEGWKVCSEGIARIGARRELILPVTCLMFRCNGSFLSTFSTILNKIILIRHFLVFLETYARPVVSIMK